MKIKALLYKSLINIFSILPFKKFICEVLRTSNIKTSKFGRDLYFTGPFNVEGLGIKFKMLLFPQGTLENDLFWKGIEGYEPLSFKIWLEFSQTSNIIFDIGANTGIFSLCSCATNASAKVYAFEPSERVLEKLIANVELNNFNIECSEIALSNVNGEQIFYDIPDGHQTSASLSPEKLKQFEGYKGEIVEVKLKTNRLDTFITENNISEIDLMKVDTELHEPEVIEGFSVHIEKFKPVILIEVLNDEVAGKLNELLKNLDYSYYNIDDNTQTLHKTNQINKSSMLNYILVPPNKENIISKFL